MSEKDYSGVTTSKIGKNASGGNSSKPTINKSSNQKTTKPLVKQSQQEEVEINNTNLIENYKKAGEIASKVKKFARELIKPNMPLVEIAEKIESKILELGGEIAFPVNLSINEIAAHYTPTLDDKTIAQGLLKIDIGVHVNGFIADTAFSLDLTPEKKYASLIKASENALKAAQEVVKKNKEDTSYSEIGKSIQEEIEKLGFAPIKNLCGHGLDEFNIHAGATIPNYENKNENIIEEGAIAIEPFATTGQGLVYDGAGSNIYHVSKFQQPRDNFAREVLEFIIENKKTLPFSQREIEKKFGKRALLALRMLERVGIVEEYSQLVEQSKGIVSQAENTLIVFNNQVQITSE
jgi:methionyl aminopeptidase